MTFLIYLKTASFFNIKTRARRKITSLFLKVDLMVHRIVTAITAINSFFGNYELSKNDHNEG